MIDFPSVSFVFSGQQMKNTQKREGSQLLLEKFMKNCFKGQQTGTIGSRS